MNEEMMSEEPLGEPAQLPVVVKKRPMAIFAIRETTKGHWVWTRIGAGWNNRDGSYNIHLDALPLDGRLHMREGGKNELPFDAVPGARKPNTYAQPAVLEAAGVHG